MRILRKDGSPIPGLYGADSMTAMMNSWAVISGAVAADSAVKSVK